MEFPETDGKDSHSVQQWQAVVEVLGSSGTRYSTAAHLPITCL